MTTLERVSFHAEVSPDEFVVPATAQGAERLGALAAGLYLCIPAIQAMADRNLPATQYLDNFNDVYEGLRAESGSDATFARVQAATAAWVNLALESSGQSIDEIPLQHEGVKYRSFNQLGLSRAGPSNSRPAVLRPTGDDNYLRIQGLEFYPTTDAIINEQLASLVLEDVEEIARYIRGARAELSYPLVGAEKRQDTDMATTNDRIQAPLDILGVFGVEKPLEALRLAELFNGEALALHVGENSFYLHAGSVDAFADPEQRARVAGGGRYVEVPLSEDAQIRLRLTPRVVNDLPASQSFLRDAAYGELSQQN
ncbi:MAG TPA: hypothetical protein VF733_05075 [Candidatus Saccharimonadales bacterium]